MSVICLHVPPHWDATHPELPWSWSDDQGTAGILAPGALPAGAREVRLLVPSDLALHAVVNVPRRGRWQEALPYALEDRLLDDPERLHVAAGPPLPDGRTPVVAIDRQWLRDAMERAAALGAPVQSAFSAAALESAAPGEWLVLMAPEGAVLIDDSGLPAVLDQVEAAEPPRLLQARLEAEDEGRRPQRIRLRARPGIDGAAMAAAWSAQLPVAVATGAPWTGQPGPLPAGSINLLQGSLAPHRSARWAGTLAAWRPVLALLAACLLLWLLSTLAQDWQWRREQARLAARSEAALRRGFPETRTILDPVLQMKRGLDDLRARAGAGIGAGPGALLARLAGAADGLPARLRHLAWQGGQLDAEWECSDAACSETLRARLQQPQRGIPDSAIQVDGQHVHARLAQGRS